ncbi:hypothetical protein AB0M58_13210 [Streptomyces bobili]|uniref:hypothetical protein n=1 Tax=Streptomyces bobili TaxID=67280 RepID=UPI003427DED4
MPEPESVPLHSPGLVAATFRSLLAQVCQDPDAGAVFIGDQEAVAVLLPISTYRILLEAAVDATENRTIAQMVAEPPAEGDDGETSTADIARLVMGDGAPPAGR